MVAPALQEGSNDLAYRQGDDIVIHPYLFAPKALIPDKLDFGKALATAVPKGAQKEARASGAQLTVARDQLSSRLTAAGGPSGSAADVLEAQERYLSMFLPFVGADEERGVPGATGGPCRLNYSWAECGASELSAWELALVAVASATAQARWAASLAADSASGVRTPAAIEAYRLLLAAAGQLDHCLRVLGPALESTSPDGASGPLQAARALRAHCLAEAQYLTALRAARKGSSPSLIAALVADAVELFAETEEAAQKLAGPWPGMDKLQRHAAYKHAALRATTIAFLAAADRQAGGAKAGQAGALAAAAETAWRETVRPAGQAFDSAAPTSLNLDHRLADEVSFAAGATQELCSWPGQTDALCRVKKTLNEMSLAPTSKRLPTKLL